MTLLTPADNVALGEWCPHHAYDPTNQFTPFRIASELTGSILDAHHPEEWQAPKLRQTWFTDFLRIDHS